MSEQSNIIPFAGPQWRRMQLFNRFAYLRRNGRFLARVYIQGQESISAAKKNKKYLEAQNNPFNRHHITAMEAAIVKWHEIIADINAQLAAAGPTLMALCDQADNICTFREKAHILGVSEQHLLSKLHNRHNDETRLYSMVFAGHAEYRGKEDFVPPVAEDMPLWTIASAWFFHLLQTNATFSKEISNSFHAQFPGIPMYQRTQQPDGTFVMQRLPPKLRLMSKEVH
jgi:hypothetical protein